MQYIFMYNIHVYFKYFNYDNVILKEFIMSIAYHKNYNQFVQYTVRMNEKVLEEIKKIAKKEDISINSCINQSLQYAINEYNKKETNADSQNG